MSGPTFFPTLPGQGWSVHKKPVFATRVASHVSGREVRAGLYAHALYEFELTFDGLDSSGGFPGLQAQSLQTLMGFFLSMQGQLNSFLYVDPTDNIVANQVIGTGDGTTTAFTLGRAIGGFYEPVSYATAISSVTINGVPVANYALNAPNTITFSGAPLGNPGTVYKEAETASSGAHASFVSGPGLNSGDVVTFGFYAKAAERSACQVTIRINTSAVCYGKFDLGAGAVISFDSGATAATIFPLANGWFYVSLTAPMAAAVTTSFSIYLMNAGASSYLGVAGDGIEVAGANYSVNGAAAQAITGSWSVAGVTMTATADSTEPPGSVIAWSGTYAFQCRLLDDHWDFENFMAGLWQNRSVKFRSIR